MVGRATLSGGDGVFQPYLGKLCSGLCVRYRLTHCSIGRGLFTGSIPQLFDESPDHAGVGADIAESGTRDRTDIQVRTVTNCGYSFDDVAYYAGHA